MSKKRTFKDKCFKDDNGTIVLGQRPNLVLRVAIVSLIISLFVSEGNVAEFIDLVVFGTFFTFAWLELFQGVNYFRRCYGFVVMVALFAFQLF
jgi:hypothetical protein